MGGKYICPYLHSQFIIQGKQICPYLGAITMKASILALIASMLTLVTASTSAQSDIKRTEYGHPDLQGTYTFRTLTPLNRPRELEHLETLTA